VFDVAFSELLVIAVVALIVIGPEKLPKVARTLGLLAGRLQRYVTNVKADLQREMQFEDLQHLQQEIKSSVEQVRHDIEGAGRQVLEQKAQLEESIRSEVNEVTAQDETAQKTALAPTQAQAHPESDTHPVIETKQ
jgi:sec-independent protein translocase protein TatB